MSHRDHPDHRRALAVQAPRRLLYRWLSNCPYVTGRPIVLQPLVLIGPGRIDFGPGVVLGWPASQDYFSGHGHFEAAAPESRISIGEGAEINNSAFFKCQGSGIRIGARALLGSHVCIYDSDFHDLRPGRRRNGRPATAAVEVGEDAFIGDRVIILKGVTIGRDAVVGAGSVVTRDVPAGAIAAGNPARVVGDVLSLAG